MNKRVFFALLFFLLLLVSSTCFATDARLATVGNHLSNSAHSAGNAAHNAVNGVQSAVTHAGGAVNSTMSNVGQGMHNATTSHNMGNKDNYGTLTGTNRTGYNAARTSTGATTPNRTSTIWMWVILAIAGVLIGSLTWYYVAQNGDNSSTGRH